MSTVKPTVTLVRQLISELRRSVPAGTLNKDNLTLRYILEQNRKFATTDAQLCRAREEMRHIAQTYLCYLRSSRAHQELQLEYHGKGERSVREIANMVGFKLPHDPK